MGFNYKNARRNLSGVLNDGRSLLVVTLRDDSRGHFGRSSGNDYFGSKG